MRDCHSKQPGVCYKCWKNSLRQNIGLQADYLDVYVMIYLKFNLHLKFRKDKIYSYLTVFFSIQAYARKYISLQLKFKKDKSFHEKGTAHWYVFTSMLLKPLKQHLIDVTSFRRQKSLLSRSFLLEHKIILVLVLQIVWIV